ncbi:hypothetical protein ScPMuIL_005723 [Solemya velum]
MVPINFKVKVIRTSAAEHICVRLLGIFCDAVCSICWGSPLAIHLPVCGGLGVSLERNCESNRGQLQAYSKE